MKKLFVSVPMVGRTDEAIRDSMERMKKIAEAVWGEELEIIDTMSPRNEPSNCKHKRLWYLGGSIQMMADADYFIGVDGYSTLYPGTTIEKEVADLYDIESYYVPLHIVLKEKEFINSILGETNE